MSAQKHLGRAVWMAIALGGWALSPSGFSLEPTSITLLHTNDLHSHFRGEKTAMGLGGVARLKSMIRKIRGEVAHSLLVDGGDWSEGNIYYNEGAGRETLRMMDHLGYDVAVVGNHDWFNGADTLLGIMDTAHPSMSLLASNIDTGDYDREEEFRRRIPPYVIKEIGGVKVAFIGLVTYEFIYDKFFKPIKITEPFALTRELAHRLKKQADAVIVISHNSISVNRKILQAAPDVDLVVGAHDHVKLTHPVVVERPGAKPAWIVEAGSWGRYLGRVELKITPGNVESVSYRLYQMDQSVPEDRETISKVETLEALIEAKRGPIFHDHVGDSELELGRSGQENLMGDFATDAYRAATGADLAIDQSNFIYNEIHEGPATTVDIFNSNPGVYNPRTDKAWTLHTIPLPGSTLSWVLNLLYGSKALGQGGALAFSGAEVIFDPLFVKQAFHALSLPLGTLDLAPAGIVLKSFKIQGEEIDSDRTYLVAAPGGIVNALQILDSILPGSVPLEKLKDTGIEDWRALSDHFTSLSPIHLDKLNYGKRVCTLQSDLGLLSSDLSWEPRGRDSQNRMIARIHVRVRNTGAAASIAGNLDSGPRVALYLNAHGVDYSIDEDLQQAGGIYAVPALAPGETSELVWDSIAIPETLGLFAVTARVLGIEGEVNHSNDETTRWFTDSVGAPRAPRRAPAHR